VFDPLTLIEAGKKREREREREGFKSFNTNQMGHQNHEDKVLLFSSLPRFPLPLFL